MQIFISGYCWRVRYLPFTSVGSWWPALWKNYNSERHRPFELKHLPDFFQTWSDYKTSTGQGSILFQYCAVWTALLLPQRSWGGRHSCFWSLSTSAISSCVVLESKPRQAHDVGGILNVTSAQRCPLFQPLNMGWPFRVEPAKRAGKHSHELSGC